ncbi:hypothetical protein GC207_15570 [bacterium]|nr:hypothetical protein [bacterium]
MMNAPTSNSSLPSETPHLTVLPDAHTNELARIADICERAARGDLEARITGASEDPEFGRLCRAINHMLDMADSFVREAAAAMAECAHDRFHRPILLRGLKGAYAQSSRIINRAGVKMMESAEHLEFTNRLAGETAANVNMIAAACEELTSTSAEISRQAKHSAELTGAAVKQGTDAADSVGGLSATARRIDDIVGLINKIADQTNLLALNATIEAARAGEHGRGFAVVANEVKDLSRSCARATSEISEQVENMHTTVKQVSGFIDGVNKTINEINEGAGTIAHSVTEQVQATEDISRNLAEASQNTSQISARIANAGKNGQAD